MRSVILGTVPRDRPHLYLYLGTWYCTIFDMHFAIGATPSEAYQKYVEETGWKRG